MRTPRQLPLDWPHESSMVRDDLVVSGANRLAVEAVDAWPDWPHPVLFVSGPPGSGKTHLAQAFAERTGALGLEASSAPRPFCAVVDDVDRSGAAAAELFALANAARLGGGSLLVTARTPPNSLPSTWLPDLRSRLRAATHVELGLPDDALLVGVLAKLFADRQLEVDPKVPAFLAARIERSLEAARVVVDRLDRESLATGRPVTRPMIASLLAGDGDAGKG